jgi:hypothetical protein
MTRPGTAVRSVATVGWAVVGLLFGHAVAYVAVYPDAHVHRDALSTSGHGWLWLAGPTVVMALAIAIGAGLVNGRAAPSRGISFRRLATIQVAAFVAIELGERIVSGWPIDQLTHDLFGHGLLLVLVIGIAIQLVTARLGAAASRLIAEVAASIEPAVTSRSRPALIGASVARLRAATTVTVHPARGPPGTAVVVIHLTGGGSS